MRKEVETIKGNSCSSRQLNFVNLMRSWNAFFIRILLEQACKVYTIQALRALQDTIAYEMRNNQ